jgi:oxygen-independent coproporphyrinogen-3 oxidase
MLRGRDGGLVRFGNVVRFGNTDDLAGYLADDANDEVEFVDRAAELEEAWFLALRLVEGVSLSWLRAEFGNVAVAAFDNSIADLIADGLLQREAERVALTLRGRMLSNEVFGRFLGVATAETILPQRVELPLLTR